MVGVGGEGGRARGELEIGGRKTRDGRGQWKWKIEGEPGWKCMGNGIRRYRWKGGNDRGV